MLRRSIVVAGLSALFVLSWSVASYALTVTSANSHMGSYAGREFLNRAYGISGADTARTLTWVRGAENPTPANWLGAEARWFKESSGALCRTSGMGYGGGENYAIFTGRGSCGAGYYFSSGKAARWKGTGYRYQYTYRTPTIHLS